MFKNWSGQVALVSGAGSEHGIGLAIAKRLGDLGAKLIITGSSARISVVRSTHQLSTQSKWPRIRNGVSIPSTGFKQLVFQIRVALWKS
jgi:Dehydrogenases with different specificities (related to short-chain alcohol dehydrogenases)